MPRAFCTPCASAIATASSMSFRTPIRCNGTSFAASSSKRVNRSCSSSAIPSRRFMVSAAPDLPTYLLAAKEMQTQFGAAKYPLAENWRSDPDLLEALNCLFGDGDWFRDTGIDYVRVHAPDDDKRQTRAGRPHQPCRARRSWTRRHGTASRLLRSSTLASSRTRSSACWPNRCSPSRSRKPRHARSISATSAFWS